MSKSNHKPRLAATLIHSLESHRYEKCSSAVCVRVYPDNEEETACAHKNKQTFLSDERAMREANAARSAWTWQTSLTLRILLLSLPLRSQNRRFFPQAKNTFCPHLIAVHRGKGTEAYLLRADGAASAIR